MGKYRTRELTQRVRYALLAGVAGAFLIPQVAAAAPTGEHDYTRGVTVGRTTTAAGTNTNITATRSAASPTTPSNNVIKWADYSVKQGETVTYDANNYLNIVTGGNTSAINGSITGGGDIYLVNPNGVIFGKTASVNVGNLYVSTQETSTVGAGDFETSGTAPLSTTAVGKADVVNMGSITANKVEVYGRSIRILDAANVHATTSPVILHTDTAANGGYAHIGYKSGAEPAVTAYEVNGANAVAADNYYQLVSTPTEFQNIKDGLTKNYMLANDIDFYDSTTGTKKSITPIGSSSSTPFKGKIEGNFYKVKNYTVQKTAGWDRYGLFGEANGAYIENLGITGVTIELPHTEPQSTYVGGLVGYTTGNTLLRHVYVTDSKIEGRNQNTGGLVGGSDNTIITESYSKAETNGGGILGYANNTGTVINDVYGDVTPIGTGTYLVYGVRYPGAPLPTGPAPTRSLEVNNSYTTGTIAYTGLTAPPVNSTYTVNKSDKKATLFGGGTSATAKDMNAVATYAGWSINNTGAPGAKWRIYEGRTLPLLTAFMDGTATATYDIRYFNANETLNSDKTNTAKSNNGADITTGLTYNSQYVKIVGKDALSGDTVVGGKSNVVAYAGAMQYNADGTPNLDHIYDYVSAGTNDFDKTNGIRNAGTKAILWSDQDGPNLRGVNVTIGKRKVDMTVDGHLTAERQYNGKLNVKDAFIKKLLNGGISTDGFTREDTDPNHPTVSLNTTGFTATMVDKHVGKGKVANFGGSITLSGEDKDNYDFDGNLAGKKGKVDITKAPLLLSFRKKKAAGRVYDGTSVVRDDTMKQSVSPGNISINKTIAAGSRGEVMTDETGTADVLALADITDPKYTDTEGNEQIHQGAHKLQYTNVKLRTDGIYSSGQDYELYYTPKDNEVPVTNDTVYLDGSIIRRQIKTGDFKVYHKTDNSAADATKVYDGTVTYDLNDPRYSDIYLSSNVGATDDDTGVVARDQGHIKFLLQNGTTATFMTDEQTPSETKNVKTAKKIAYKVHADADTHTDGYGGHLLDDYWVVNDKDTALTESTNFNATGKGTITPKTLKAEVVNGLTKVYDGWTQQTDGNRTLTPGKDLVTISGYVAGDSPRTNTSRADYASPNVVWDATNQTEKAQNVTYHVSFDRGTGDESENYILDANATGDARYGIELTQDSAGKNYTGTIKRRPITINMGTVDKIYDGTAVNTKSNITGLAGKTAGDTIAATVLADDGITAATLKAQHATMLSAGTAHSSFGRGTGNSFAEDVNASNGTEHDVRYQNVGDVLQEALAAAKKHNYTIDDTIYGKGTINRRLIENSGFQVRKTGGTPANATKVYDGTNTFTLAGDEYLVAKPSTNPSATPGTGIVAKDVPNIVFKMTGNEGHFLKSGSGTAVSDRTTHVSEAARVAYDVYADTLDGTTSPLSNYEFGTTISKRNLEAVTAANPDAVTAEGRITSAKIVAETVKNLNKTYDGVTGYTKGDRNTTAASVTGENVIKFKHLNQNGSLTDGLINDASGMPVNSSTAAYVDKNVLYNTQKEPVAKAMNYTAKLTGTYADDYVIVDANDPNTKLSTMTEPGGTKNVSTVFNNVADAGTITPRKLNITMESVSKVYDTKAENTASNNTATAPSGTVATITDDPKSSVIGTILSGESTPITEAALGAAWRTRRDHNGATSTYGHKGSTTFSDDANASAATNGHDVVYHDMDKAFKDAFGTVAAGNYTVDADAYGKGTITPKAVDPNQFDVVDANGHTVPNAKTYDGTSDRPIEDTWKIQSGATTGLYAQDASHISFALSSKGAYYIDKNGKKTAQTTNTGTTAETDIDAVKAAYHVTAHAEEGHEKLLKNYTLNGQTLDSGEATVYGSGKITRRTINIGLSEPSKIDKVYDGTRNLVDGTVNGKELHHSAFVDADAKANVVYAAGTANDNKLVRTKNGAKVDDNAVVTVTGSYADKKVVHNPSGGFDEKTITYNVSIGDNVGKNYTLSYNDGTTTHTKNAEEGLYLSAKGTITPKDLSGAFAKITKVYDGTTDVDHTANPTVTPAQVGFTAGAVIAGDDVRLATHNEAFQSANVRGDGTTKTIGGTEQKNWINYTNVTLGGADAGNYELKPDTDRKLYGLGEIKPFEIDDNTHIVYGTITPARKTYDGTRAVKKLVGSVESAKNEDVKGYIQHAYITLGTWTKDLIDRMNVDSATYDTKDVASTSKDVTYNLIYTPEADGNIIMKPGTQVVKAYGKGTILKRDVTVTVKNPLTKEYDAGPAVKDASGKIITGDALNDLVTLDGLTKDDAVAVTKNDNTTYTTKAVYVDTDAGTGDRHVKYTITLNSNAGNYNLKYKSGNGNEFSTNDNTITKRSVEIKFKDPTSPQPFTRQYNGSARNKIIHPYVSADDAAVLKTDANALVSGTDLVGLTGISSTYVKDDKTTPDPNVGKNKYIRFDGVDTALGTALAGKVANYTFTIGSATGEITKRTITANDLKKGISFTRAEKEYDATKDIVNAKGNLEHAYILDAHGTPLVDDTGAKIDLKDFFDIDNARTHYNVTENADTNPQSVTYGLVYRGGANPNLTLGPTTFDMTGTGYGGSTIDGIIKRRVLQIGVLKDKDVDKIYDTTNTAYNGDLDHAALATRTSASNIGYAAGATEKQKIVDNAKVHVDAVYDGTDVIRDTDPDRTVKKNVRNITYKVRIDGNAGKNYQLSDGTTTVDAEDANGLPLSATGAITPRKLTLSFAAGDSKQYDGSAKYLGTTKTINNIDVDDTDGKGTSTITTDDISAASFDLTDVVGLYGTGNTDATFKKDANAGSKTIQYSKLKNTLKNTASRLHNKDNYDVVDTGYGAGAITKRTITANDLKKGISFTRAEKEYDATKDIVNAKGNLEHAYILDAHGTPLVDDTGAKIDLKDFFDIDNARTHYNVTENADTNPQSVTYGLVYRGGANPNLTLGPTTFDMTGTGYGGSTIDGIIKRRVLQIGVLKDKDVDKIYDTTNTAYNGDLDHAALATRTSASNIGYAAGATEKQKIVDNAKVHVDAVYDGTDVIRDTDPDRTVKKNVRNITYKVRIDGNAGKNYQLSDGTTTVDAEDANGLPLSATGAITPRKLTLSFAAGDSKQYDGSAKYLGTTKTINNIDVDDTDGKGTSTITTDDISAASFDLTDVVGLYGTGNTDATFKKDANAGSKTIQYSKLKNTLKNTASRLHNKDNYDVVDTGYGVGAITKRTLTEDEWRQGIHFDAVTKEYDGTEVVKNNGDASAEALKKLMDRANVIIGGNVLKDDDGKPIDITADLAVSVDPHKTKYNTKNVVDVSGQPRVTYTLTYSGANFEPATFTKTGEGTITPRRIYADVQDFHPVKVYDKNDAIVGSVKDDAGRPLTEEDLQKYAVYRHYVDPTTGDPQDTKAFVDVDATPHMTAKFSDEKVAWKDGSWRNTPQGDAKDVVYAFSLSGASAAENYAFVDQDGNPIMQSVTGTTRSTGERPRADGRIDPYRIELRGRSEPYEIRVNEAVPSTFDGSPIGRNYSTPLGESLDGEISYRADVPAKGPRWGIDYPIYGHYQPGSSDLYQNYYFDSVPGTLRVNTYVPDYEYDKAMTQVSKMTPDEYAYENASLDRTNHYSRKPTAQVDPVPPAINVVKDGVDIRQNDINVLDDTVYTIVDEVFG